MKNIKILFIVVYFLLSVNLAFAGGGSDGGPEPMLISSWQDYASVPINSPDWSKFVFVNYEGEKPVVFLNWKVFGTYDAVDEAIMNFDNNNKLYIKVKMNNKWHMIIDWKNQEEYDDILWYNPNYWAVKNDYLYSYVWVKDSKYFLVYNWVELSVWYDFIDSYPNTSEDYNTIIYIAKDKDWALFIINWVPSSKRYNDISYTTFSPNWKIFVNMNYTLDGKVSLIINWNKEIWKYDSIWNIVFSPDNKKMYYSIVKNEKNYFVVNWKIIDKGYDLIKEFYYSRPTWKFFFQTVWKDWKEYLIVNWKSEKMYDEVWYIMVSNDEKKYAYFAREWDNWVTVVNWVEIK